MSTNYNNTHDTGEPGRSQHELVGVCAVDSAQLLIVDPLYLRNITRETAEKLVDECFDVSCGRVMSNHGHSLATVIPTGYGDGAYPVYAVRDENGRVMRVEIRFDELAKLSDNDDDPAVMMQHRAELLGSPEPMPDEAAILDGEQGFVSRLRVEPEGLREHMHEYVDTALRIQHNVEKRIGTGSDEPELQARIDYVVEHALHDLIDGMLDAWRVWSIVDEHRMAQRVSVMALRDPEGWAR